jgi:hypothetical protein
MSIAHILNYILCYTKKAMRLQAIFSEGAMLHILSNVTSLVDPEKVRSAHFCRIRINIGIQSMPMRIRPIDINSNQVYFLLCHENINMLSEILKGTVSRDFLLLVFLMNQLPPSPRVLGPFRIFSKICGDNRNSRCTTGINDTGGKFATGVNDTGGK